MLPRRLLPALVPITAMLLAAWPAFGYAVLPMDEGTLLVYPELALGGAVPHRDFQTLYGPGNVWALAAAYAALGVSVEVERAVGVLWRLGVVLGVYAFAARWGASVAVASALVSLTMLVVLGLVASAAIGALALLVWSTLAVARLAGRRGALLGGLLAGAALLFRPDYAPAAVGPVLVLLGRASRERWVAYAGGLLAGLIPFAVHAAVATPEAIVENLVVDALRAVPSRRLPFPPDDPSDAALVAIVVAAALWCVALGIGGWRADAPPRRELLAFGTLSVLLLPQVWQRADALHIGYAAAVVAPLLAVCAAETAGRLLPRLSAGARSALAIALVIALVPTTRPDLVARTSVDMVRELGVAPVEPALVRRQARAYPEKRTRATDLGALVAAIDRHARPGMRVFVGPQDLTRTNYNDTILYFLYPDLVPASYYLEMEPWTANRPGSRLAADIASADLLALTSRWDDWDEPNASSLHGSDEAARVVAERFTLAWEGAEYRLYVRR